jgi:hypothetical protein
MGYVVLNLKKDHKVRTFNFFYGSYADGLWHAHLIEPTTRESSSFTYKTLKECYAKLERLVEKYGRLQAVRGSTVEYAFIENLTKNFSC